MPNLDGNPATPTPGDNILGASYIVDGSGVGEAQLTNRRILTAGANVTLTDNGPGGTLVVAAAAGAGGYATVENNGTPVTQRTTLNLSTELAATDAGGKTALALATAGVGFTKLANLTAVSVLGRSTSTTGVMAAITAAAADTVLRRDGVNDLGFGLLVNANIDAAAAIAHSKLASGSARSVLGRNVNSVGALASIAGGGANTVLIDDGSSLSFAALAHSALSGLTSGDPHTQYALLAGRSGGQTLNGDTASGGNLRLDSTANATKGGVLIHVASAASNIAGSLSFRVADATGGMTMGFADRTAASGGWIECSNGTITGFVGHTDPSNSQFVLGTFSNHRLTLRTANTNRFTITGGGNVGFLSNAGGTAGDGSYGGGTGVLSIANAAVAPGTPPAGGGVLYAASGAAKWYGSSGTTTTFGPAEPHCPVCGSDFMTEHENRLWGYLSVCLRCLSDELGPRPWILRVKPSPMGED